LEESIARLESTLAVARDTASAFEVFGSGGLENSPGVIGHLGLARRQPGRFDQHLAELGPSARTDDDRSPTLEVGPVVGQEPSHDAHRSISDQVTAAFHAILDRTIEMVESTLRVLLFQVIMPSISSTAP
jgi:hypothetical protein